MFRAYMLHFTICITFRNNLIPTYIQVSAQRPMSISCKYASSKMLWIYMFLCAYFIINVRTKREFGGVSCFNLQHNLYFEIN